MADRPVKRETSITYAAGTSHAGLIRDLRSLIASARQDVARQVNSTLVLLHWRIGTRIRQDILKEKRAGYGAKIVSALGRQLAIEHGQGFSEKNLWRMVQFAEVFPQEQIVATLSRQLSQDFGPGWSRRNLFNMVRFADVFDDQKIVHALSAQLGWTHFRHIIYLDDKIKRDFTKTLPQAL